MYPASYVVMKRVSPATPVKIQRFELLFGTTNLLLNIPISVDIKKCHYKVPL